MNKVAIRNLYICTTLLFSDIAIKLGETLHIEKKVSILCLFLYKPRTLKWK